MYSNMITSGCWNRVFVCTDPAYFFICVICHWVYTPQSQLLSHQLLCKLSIIQRLVLKTYLADKIKDKKREDLEHVFVSCDRQSESMGRMQIRKQRICVLGQGLPLSTSQVMFLHMQRRGKSNGLQGNVETQMWWWVTLLWSNTGLHIWYTMICSPRWASQVVLVVKNLPSNAGGPSRFSHVWLCATPWTTAHQAPLFMGFPRQEYWSGFSRVNLNKCFPEGHSVWIPCVYVCGSMYPDVGMVTWDWEGMADTRAVQGCYIQVTVCWWCMNMKFRPQIRYNMLCNDKNWDVTL